MARRFNPAALRSAISRAQSASRRAQAELRMAQRRFEASMRRLQHDAQFVGLHIVCTCGHDQVHRYHVTAVPSTCPSCGAPIVG